MNEKVGGTLVEGTDWRGIGLPVAPVCVCVVVAAGGNDSQQAVPLRKRSGGADVSKGGPVCYQREVEICYPTQSKCLAGALTHTH